jgi:prepilin-type N-terminal cleavage/methylation domain-containing protein
MKGCLPTNRKKAFTLIELLIVVAIIAILAAIAVPNFLEAQVRSKCARAKTDMRTLKVALESYRVDTNKYPPDEFGPVLMYRWLTTPVSYITSVLYSPFDFKNYERDFGIKPPHPYDYANYSETDNAAKNANIYYVLICPGPDQVLNMLWDAPSLAGLDDKTNGAAFSAIL